MNARFVTLVLLLFVWLEGDSVWAQYLPKLYQVFSPDKKLKMAIQRHNDGLLTYTFAANREILIKESPLGFKLESQETVPSSGWKIEKVSDRKVRDEWKPRSSRTALTTVCPLTSASWLSSSLPVYSSASIMTLSLRRKKAELNRSLSVLRRCDSKIILRSQNFIIS